MSRPLRACLTTLLAPLSAPLLAAVALWSCVAPAPIHHVTLVSEPVPAAAPARASADASAEAPTHAAEPPTALPAVVHDHAPGGSDCTLCAALAATPPHPDTGHQPPNVGTNCSICAGLRTPPPTAQVPSNTPGGHGPPPGHGAPPPGTPVTGAGPR